jgi:hypothetical protein
MPCSDRDALSKASGALPGATSHSFRREFLIHLVMPKISAMALLSRNMHTSVVRTLCESCLLDAPLGW